MRRHWPQLLLLSLICLFRDCFAACDNLLLNGGPDTNSLASWTVTSNGGSGYRVVTVSAGNYYLITSSSWCERRQVIDLATFVPAPPYDGDITIEVRETVQGSSPNCADKYRLVVSVEDISGAVLSNWTTGQQTCPSNCSPLDVSHTFVLSPSQQPRTITFIDGGQDVEGRSNQFGTRFRDASVTIKLADDNCVEIAGPDTITLQATIHDVEAACCNQSSLGHPDFQISARVNCSLEKNMVNKTLGPDRKPVYAHHGGSPCRSVTSPARFAQFWNDFEAVSQSIPYNLVLTRSVLNPKVYELDSTSFFPIDGQGWGNGTFIHNYHFCMEVHSRFTYLGGEVFNFLGDDDLWVFIDNTLVIDLGGVHAATGQSIALHDLTNGVVLQIGQTYNFDLFFCERQTVGSNLIVSTSIELQGSTGTTGSTSTGTTSTGTTSTGTTSTGTTSTGTTGTTSTGTTSTGTTSTGTTSTGTTGTTSTGTTSTGTTGTTSTGTTSTGTTGTTSTGTTSTGTTGTTSTGTTGTTGTTSTGTSGTTGTTSTGTTGTTSTGTTSTGTTGTTSTGTTSTGTTGTTSTGTTSTGTTGTTSTGTTSTGTTGTTSTGTTSTGTTGTTSTGTTGTTGSTGTGIWYEAPVMLDARFSSDGSSIAVRFDKQTDQGGLVRTWPCEKLFFGVETLLGTGSTCSFPDKSTVTITLGNQATILAGAPITLVPNRLFHVYGHSLASTGSVLLQNPIAPHIPIASISGRSTVGSCDVVTLSGLQSSGTGTRTPTYAWSVAAGPGLVFPDPTFPAFVSLTTAANLTFPGARIPYGTTTFFLQVTSFLGPVSAVASRSLTKSSSDVQPTVSILNASPFVVKRPVENRLQARVTLSACAQTAPVLITWTLVSGPALAGAIGSTTPTLVLPAFSLEVEQTYVFKCTAASSLAPTDVAFDLLTVQVQRSTLVAVITGLNRQVGHNVTIAFGGESSVDPDQLSGASQYAWTCTSTATGAPCIDARNSPATLALSGGSISLPAGTLEPGSYTFRLVVTKLGQSANTTASLTVAVGDVPNVQVTQLTAANPTQRLQLTGTASPSGPGLSIRSVQWSCLLGDFSFATGALTSSTDRELVIAPGALTPGQAYTFRFSASDGFSSNYADSSFTVLPLPSGGSISVDPPNGFAGTTAFTLSAPGWVANNPLPNLEYSFSFTRDGRSTLLHSYSPSPTVTPVYIPTQGDQTVTLTVVVSIRNADGCVQTASTPLQLAPEDLDLEASRRRLQAARDSQDHDSTLNIGGTIAAGVAGQQDQSAGQSGTQQELLDAVGGVVYGGTPLTPDASEAAAGTLSHITATDIRDPGLQSQVLDAAEQLIPGSSRRKRSEGSAAPESLSPGLAAAILDIVDRIAVSAADSNGGEVPHNVSQRIAGILDQLGAAQLADKVCGETYSVAEGENLQLQSGFQRADQLSNSEIPGTHGSWTFPSDFFPFADLFGGVDTCTRVVAYVLNNDVQSPTTVEPFFAECEPVECADIDARCGTSPDGCGGTIACGFCAAGSECNTEFHSCVDVSLPPRPAAPSVAPWVESVVITWSAGVSNNTRPLLVVLDKSVVSEGTGEAAVWEEAHSATTNELSVTLTGLTPGAALRFRLSTVNSFGHSDYTDIVEVTPLSPTTGTTSTGTTGTTSTGTTSTGTTSTGLPFYILTGAPPTGPVYVTITLAAPPANETAFIETIAAVLGISPSRIVLIHARKRSTSVTVGILPVESATGTGAGSTEPIPLAAALDLKNKLETGDPRLSGLDILDVSAPSGSAPVPPLYITGDFAVQACENTAVSFNLSQVIAAVSPYYINEPVPDSPLHPQHGSLSQSGTVFTYVPFNFVGTDTFRYTVTDDVARCASGLVVITVAACSGPPESLVFATRKLDLFACSGVPLAFNVSDSVTHGLSFYLSLPPSESPLAPQRGSLSQSGVLLTYTSDISFVGADHFAYTAVDSLGRTAVGRVTVNVSAECDSVTRRRAAAANAPAPAGTLSSSSSSSPSLLRRLRVADVAHQSGDGVKWAAGLEDGTKARITLSPGQESSILYLRSAPATVPINAEIVGFVVYIARRPASSGLQDTQLAVTLGDAVVSADWCSGQRAACVWTSEFGGNAAAFGSAASLSAWHFATGAFTASALDRKPLGIALRTKNTAATGSPIDGLIDDVTFAIFYADDVRARRVPYWNAALVPSSSAERRAGAGPVRRRSNAKRTLSPVPEPTPNGVFDPFGNEGQTQASRIMYLRLGDDDRGISAGGFNFSGGVTITIELPENLPEDYSVRCAYKENLLRQWVSDDTCQLTKRNATHAECTCYHLSAVVIQSTPTCSPRTCWDVVWRQQFTDCRGTTCSGQQSWFNNSMLCSLFADGCGGTLSCGVCPNTLGAGGSPTVQACTATGCVDGSNAAAIALRSTACGDQCGLVWANGGSVYCPCGTGSSCVRGRCVVCDTCASTRRSCGNGPDQCGGSIRCGSCATGSVCTTAGVCSAPTTERTAVCTPLAACPAGWCGAVPDGCGGYLSCATCASNLVCSSANRCVPPCKTCWDVFNANLRVDTCPCRDPSQSFLPISSMQCQQYSDGCGNVITCGTCNSGYAEGSVLQTADCVPGYGCVASPATVEPVGCTQSCNGQCGLVFFSRCGSRTCTCPAGEFCYKGLCTIVVPPPPRFSFSVDGGSGYLSGSPAVTYRGSGLTLQMWIYANRADATSARDQYIFYNGHAAYGGFGIKIDAKQSTPYVSLFFAEVSTNVTQKMQKFAYALPLRAWAYFSIVSEDGLNWSAYENGVFKASVRMLLPMRPPVAGANTDVFSVAGSLAALYDRGNFDGRLDNVQLYERALTATQIAASMAGVSGSETGLVLYLPFNEGSGQTTSNAGGRTYKLTLTGTPTSPSPAYAAGVIAPSFKWIDQPDSIVTLASDAAARL